MMRQYLVLWTIVVLINARQVSKCNDTLKAARDFGMFLEKSVDGKPDEGKILSDNAWETSGKFEGDMVLEESQRQMLVDQVVKHISRNAIKGISKQWPHGKVVYLIDYYDFNPTQVYSIMEGMNYIEVKSCIRFREKNESDKNYIKFVGKNAGCYSMVGFIGGEQIINFQSNACGCFALSVVTHEILHSLGFFHMQSHHKRDDYEKIAWNNIKPGYEFNFQKYSTGGITNFGIPYDSGSIMHYSDTAFSKDGSKTIIPLKSNALIGQRSSMSRSDIKKLNIMYKCKGRRSNVKKRKKKMLRKGNEKVQVVSNDGAPSSTFYTIGRGIINLVDYIMKSKK